MVRDRGDGPGRGGRRLAREAVAARRRTREAEARAAGRAGALATLSHEMREPLNGVAGLAHLLKDTHLDPEQQSYVEAIAESADTLVTLVNDLLDVARIDAGRIGIEAVPFSPLHLLESVRRMLEPRARARSLDFALEVAQGLPEMAIGDPGRLRQVLVNLAGNALKFTPEGAVRIRAAATMAAGFAGLELAVEDTGIGMSPTDFERLVAPFAQGDARVARLYGGSGLGLLIARRLLDAMGGSLDCETPVAGGTRLVARLRVPIGERPEPGRLPTLAGASLLVVDPLERTRSSIRDLATLWGLDVRAARDGREAVALLLDAAGRGRPFDVVIVDAGIDDPTPEELAARVRRDQRQAHVRLALQAPAGFRGDAAQARAAGFSAYLPKPLDPELLRACLQRLLDDREGGELLTVHRIVEARRSARVLVVDDNPVNRRLATILLERAGHAVASAAAGEEALDKLGREPFDVVLMDVQMPGMDGLEATRRIRALADPTRASVPILAVTAGAGPGDDARCLAAGMNAHLMKPIDGASLIAAVERLAALPAA